MSRINNQARTGLWFIGALGDVATTVAVGLMALKHEVIPRTGLTTELPQFQDLDFPEFGEFIIGGHDLRSSSWAESAQKLEEQIHCFSPAVLKLINEDLLLASENLRTGIFRGTSSKLIDLETSEEVPARASVENVKRDLHEFRDRNHLDQVVIIHLTSTEPQIPEQEWFHSLGKLNAAIDANDPTIPASVLYAVAAFEAQCAFVNFTPCLGSSIPALEELAIEQSCPHSGKDGKTGETLLRTVLAPMFAARHLRVLSWSGFNILGNRDGQVLSDPKANAAKTSGKDAVLKSVLGDLIDDSLTRIDYVPSLKDFKTAWDFIHFEGFLNTKMSMQVTWQGADSALAAPLVIDLARIMVLCQRRGLSGAVPELGCFFKNPIGSDENAFDKQFLALTEFLLVTLQQPKSIEVSKL